ncbi:MAG: tRNA 2-thiocytidine biosynthesis protein TtcA [Desulfovibrionaceae bacterium]|nr:tRNA 2-thiocytidine biosynthesis protein TtcA [Desulfovibrionaceae bacterium]MBF0512740.1 tRNA 2-thiocytidine biosynthesis protein TtcA [Desulfovibrionaceae bacterium]
MAVSHALSFAQRRVVSLAGKLMFDTRMLAPGARLGVAVSGGVDSLALLAVLAHKRRIVPFPIEIMLLHANPGFDPVNHIPLIGLAREMGVAAHIAVTDFGPRAHSPENKKRSACFWCAWNRRKLLFDLCSRYRLSHLAMGHNADDLVSTFALNLVQGGRVDALSARESFFDGRLTLVRPLLFVEKKVIRKAAKDWNLPVFDNPCPSAGSSRRAELAERMRLLSGGDKRLSANILSALRRFQLDRDMGKP